MPFVDVVTTMLDPSLPLTITEWEEWGDPREPEAYARMKAYSPYDNVRAADYPALLVTTGLNDPRVQYWEPAKWVAKLRELSTSGKPIYLRTEMGAGHGGPSGRYDAWRDEAIVLAVRVRRRRRYAVSTSPTHLTTSDGLRLEAEWNTPAADIRAIAVLCHPHPAVRRHDAQHRHSALFDASTRSGHRVPALQLPGSREQRRRATPRAAPNPSTSSRRSTRRRRAAARPGPARVASVGRSAPTWR